MNRFKELRKQHHFTQQDVSNALKGQGSNHPNILDYMNQANREIKYQAECPYCHAQVHQGIVGEPKSLFDGPDAEGSAWTFGLDITIEGSKMLCNG